MIVYLSQTSNLAVTLDPASGLVEATYGQCAPFASTVVDAHHDVRVMVRSARVWVAQHAWFTDTIS